ncbi:YfhO family protein [Candidatus Daviesbacteria bacterium]|nr:YfhO family protein [Candidatus Daviesbacteria bacterium]
MILIVFIGLILLFFYQVFLGLLPIPADIIAGGYYPWLDYKWGYSVGVPVKNPMMSDVISVIYPIKALAVDLIRQNQLPLWNSQMFLGYPLFANFQIALLFPTMLFYLFFSIPIAWTLQVMFQPFLALILMYLFLRHLKLNQIPAILGSISYAFGGFGLVYLEWNTLTLASAFLPLLLLLVDKIVTEGRKKWLVLLSFTVALQLLAGYPQIVVFSMVAVALFLVLRLGLSKLLQAWKIILFLFLGVGLVSIFLFPGFEQFLISQRRVEKLDFDLMYLPWQNLINLIVPDYFGSDATGNFWGKGNSLSVLVYSGLISSMLALGGFWQSKNRFWGKYFLGLIILSLIIMLPSPISAFLQSLGLWGGSGASVTRAAFMVNFALSSLAAFGLEYLILKKISKNTTLHAALVIFGLLVLLTIVAWLLNFKVALRNLILPWFLSLSLLLTLIFAIKFQIKKRLIQLIIISFLVVELFHFGWKFNSFSDAKLLYPDTDITNFLKNHPGRIDGGDAIPANMWLPFNLESASGYDAVYPFRTAKFIAVVNSLRSDAVPSNRFGTINNYNSPLFDLTGTKYILALKRDSNKSVSKTGIVDTKFQLPKLHKVYEYKSVVILENTQAFPQAFLVPEVLNQPQDQVLTSLLSNQIDLRKVAVAEQSNVSLKPDDKVDLKNFTPTLQQIANNHLQVQASSPIDSFLVVLNSYYPGWKAQIDNQPTSIYKTNYAFQGIFLPKGQHNVDLIYEPVSLKLGSFLSAGFLILLLAIITWPSKR